MSDEAEIEKNNLKEVTELCFDIIENHKDTLIYYLSESATLDWFGQTVKGQKNIITFMKTKVGKLKHEFPNPNHVSKIGYRDTHIIKTTKTVKTKALGIENITSISKDITPPNQEISIPSSSQFVEKGQGDGLHNCRTSESPLKKTKLDTDESLESPIIKYVSAEGNIEFQKRSTKKLQSETKWSRPCKLEFAYSGSNKKDFTLYLIIYQGNTKCRRNLLKEFEAEESLD